MSWLRWPTAEETVMTTVTVMMLFYGWVSVTLIWHSRRQVVWDYERQQWRSAWLVKRERDHAPGRCR
jgi:hypothetical protein